MRQNPECEIHEAAEGLNDKIQEVAEAMRLSEPQGSKATGIEEAAGMTRQTEASTQEKPWMNWNRSPGSQEAAGARRPRNNEAPEGQALARRVAGKKEKKER